MIYRLTLLAAVLHFSVAFNPGMGPSAAQRHESPSALEAATLDRSLDRRTQSRWHTQERQRVAPSAPPSPSPPVTSQRIPPPIYIPIVQPSPITDLDPEAVAPVTKEESMTISGGGSKTDAKAKQEVLAVTKKWLDTVTSGRADAPQRTASLYHRDAVLWATLSEELRVTPSEIKAYFDVFCRLPKLKVWAYKPHVRVYGESVATNHGYYTFVFQDEQGGWKQKRARFTFVFRRKGSSWVIMDHHSSAMPVAPPSLEPGHTVLFD